MIYAITRYHVEHDRKILIVVPTTSLIEQMYKDFEDYGWMLKNIVTVSMLEEIKPVIMTLQLLHGSQSIS